MDTCIFPEEHGTVLLRSIDSDRSMSTMARSNPSSKTITSSVGQPIPRTILPDPSMSNCTWTEIRTAEPIWDLVHRNLSGRYQHRIWTYRQSRLLGRHPENRQHHAQESAAPRHICLCRPAFCGYPDPSRFSQSVTYVPKNGAFESIVDDNNLVGWAADHDNPANSINVKVYMDGKKDGGTYRGSFPTEIYREDINTEFGLYRQSRLLGRHPEDRQHHAQKSAAPRHIYLCRPAFCGHPDPSRFSQISHLCSQIWNTRKNSGQDQCQRLVLQSR